MSMRTIAIIGLVIAALAGLATLAVPLVESRVQKNSVSIRVVKPIKLSLLNTDGRADTHVTTVLLTNTGRQEIAPLSLPLAFTGVRAGSIKQYDASTTPAFKVAIAPLAEGNGLLVTSDFLNPGDAINVALVTGGDPGEVQEPRIKGVAVRVSKTTFEAERVTAWSIWLEALTALLTAFTLIFLMYVANRLRRLNLKMKD